MDIPRRLIELQRAVDAADNRYRDNSGENATAALAVPVPRPSTRRRPALDTKAQEPRTADLLTGLANDTSF